MADTFKIAKEARHQVIAQERLYLTKDGKVCKEGDKDAATLLAAVGQPIPLKQAIALGIVKPEGVDPEARSTRPSEVTHKR